MTDTPEPRTKTIFTVTSGSNDGGLEQRVEPMTDAPPFDAACELKTGDVRYMRAQYRSIVEMLHKAQEQAESAEATVEAQAREIEKLRQEHYSIAQVIERTSDYDNVLNIVAIHQTERGFVVIVGGTEFSRVQSRIAELEGR